MINRTASVYSAIGSNSSYLLTYINAKNKTTIRATAKFDKILAIWSWIARANVVFHLVFITLHVSLFKEHITWITEVAQASFLRFFQMSINAICSCALAANMMFTFDFVCDFGILLPR